MEVTAFQVSKTVIRLQLLTICTFAAWIEAGGGSGCQDHLERRIRHVDPIGGMNKLRFKRSFGGHVQRLILLDITTKLALSMLRFYLHERQIRYVDTIGGMDKLCFQQRFGGQVHRQHQVFTVTIQLILLVITTKFA